MSLASVTARPSTSHRQKAKITDEVLCDKGLARPTRIIAPTSAATASACAAAPSTRGCRLLEYVYASATTATSTAFGDVGGQVREIRLWSTEHGVSGELKNLIFAADGPKPQIVLPDSISNTIRIVKNEQISLRERLRRSLGDNGAELLVFDTYLKPGFNLPALIPQVYLHYDPYTISQLGGASRLARQRMDFLLLMNHRVRAVIEVDGIQHYARPAGRTVVQEPGVGWLPDPARYASLVAEVRELTLQGYEVYRIGGHELWGDTAAEMLTGFFVRLLHRHGHADSN
ncbi:hypothetical protein [Streptomyces sp. NPDC088789]|uniref:hypothetical protein n=1 Tax=Streptomyces sp. NPDC088789 TaxID=3365899 RepID=UPI003806E8BB